MVPYATSACGRTVWVLFMITGLITTSSMLLNGVCLDAGYEVFAYSAVSIIVAALSIFLELMIAKASTHGTIIGDRVFRKTEVAPKSNRRASTCTLS